MSEIRYEADSGGWRPLCDALKPTQMLTFGTDDIEAIDGIEIRRALAPSLPLPAGLYAFRLDTGWSLLVAATPQPSLKGATAARFDRIEDDHPLALARRWFETLWPTGQPLGSRARFARGDTVEIVGSPDVGEIVADPQPAGDTFVYSVRSNGRTRTVGESGLRSFDVASADPSAWLHHPSAGAVELGRLVTLTKLTNALADTLYSDGASKTVIGPYQFKPVLRLLESPHKRLLIADEVGLGKTIEAGLVWTELEQRAQMSRVLVVCPAMLVRKWRDEMRRRFGRTVRILDRMAMGELIDHVRTGDDHTQFYGVVSLERLRSSDQLAELEEAGPAFDLVIVDEAHYLRNASTVSYELGERLADWADALLFLSATPLNLGQDDLFNLVNLLLPLEFPDKAVFRQQLAPNGLLTQAGRYLREHPDDPTGARDILSGLSTMAFGPAVMERPEFAELEDLLSRDRLGTLDQARTKRLLADLHTLSSVVSRTRRADVPDVKAKREALEITVDWTEEERHFYNAVYAWTWARAKARGVPPGFAAQMPLRQTASCIPAMVQRLSEPDLDSDEDEDADEDDFDEDSGSGQATSADPEAADLASELRDLLRDRAQRLRGVDTKFDEFKAALDRARATGSPQVMVFSFFRRTLEYLATRLRGHVSCEVMHGGVPVPVRERIMERFRAGEFDVLLLSEVGSEGLDFEFCNILFNYDLPWNPMRVEQRIGRLDRFGQQHERIFIHNFKVPGTIETDIFGRLYQRLRIFESSIGELEPILRDEFADVQRVVLDPKLSEGERGAELRRIEVAFHERSEQLDELRAAESELIGLDQLIVDGLERDVDRGRYVGHAELRSLVDLFLTGHGCSPLKIDADLRAELVGSADVARAVQRANRSQGASRFSLSELSMMLNDGDPIPVTFDPDDASRTDRELLSIRHPLVLAAVQHAGADTSLRAARFASAATDGPRSGNYLVLLSLLEVSGLRPTLELLPIAVDLERRSVVDDIGDLFLGAVARGELRPAGLPDPADLQPALLIATSFANGELTRIENERRQTNSSLVATRIATVRAEASHKVQKARRTLSDPRVHGQPRLRRLYEGRIRNVQADEARKVHDLEARSELAVSLEPRAIVALRVSGQT